MLKKATIPFSPFASKFNKQSMMYAEVKLHKNKATVFTQVKYGREFIFISFSKGTYEVDREVVDS